MDEREKIKSIIRPIIKDRFLLYCHEAKDCINCDTDCQVSLAAKDFADALIAAGIGDVKAFGERVKMAFYYEFDELIPSIMADKIDELVEECAK